MWQQRAAQVALRKLLAARTHTTSSHTVSALPGRFRPLAQSNYVLSSTYQVPSSLNYSVIQPYASSSPVLYVKLCTLTTSSPTTSFDFLSKPKGSSSLRPSKSLINTRHHITRPPSRLITHQRARNCTSSNQTPNNIPKAPPPSEPRHPTPNPAPNASGSTSGPNKPIEPPKHEHYSALLWRRLKSYPMALREFIGLGGPLTLDKVLPFFNLMFVGIGVGVLVGTTTVVSLIVWVVNRNEHWKELTAKKVGAYLTYQTGINIEYGALSASWSDGTLELKKVKIWRDPFSLPEGVSRNVTALHLDIDHLSVKISLLWLLQGNGILKHLSAEGITGFVEQRHLDWSGPPAPRRVRQRGDFYLDSFELANANISLFMNSPDRELKVQIHSINCNPIRRQWLLHDILRAESAYGIFDGSLFSLTRLPKRSHADEEIRSSLKIDGIKSDIISSASTGPVSWITEGTFDLDVFLTFKSDFLEQGWHYHLDTNSQTGHYSKEDLDPVVLDLDVKMKMNNLRADIPITTDQLSFISKALVIPVVAYMNTNYTCIELSGNFTISKQNFDGAWSPWEANLFDALSAMIAEEFVSLVKQQQTSTNIQKHLLMVIKSLHRGIYFLSQQIQSYYSLWYFNNDEHPEDLYAL